MARLEGFEPPTPGLEGRCSIQLSYRRVRHLRYTSGSRLIRLEVFLKCRNASGGSAGARNEPLDGLPKMGRGQVRVSLAEDRATLRGPDRAPSQSRSR
jgi:hypothetical protein